ncbi:MAG TPA: M1 family aminopeptidase [Candidatus Binataceae bacterium]|nr:M1 family aminopeptidase [Candidatus Binataceae bacterium]
MHKPRFLDQVALELGDRHAFTGRFARGRRPFQPAHVEPKWPRDRAAEIKHIKLEVALDFERKRISGTATHRVAAIADGLATLEFDAAELEIAAVRAAGEPAAFESADHKLRVTLASPLAAGAEIELAIDYSATPRRGLYFVGPDDAYPDKPVQAWTQGEDEDSRYWFPCYDYPNNRTTSEVIATVPEAFTAVSNGAQISVEHNRAAHTRSFHFRHDVPHSAYLITLAAGEFTVLEDHAGATPVLYYVQPGREDDARRAFGNTPKMIEFFERKIGVPYPYAKYAQVAVSDFIFGGMENTSATTQTADTMHDARAHLDFKSDPLVAHELAHQWWGDLLTCRDWSHAWLNEGFATYFEALWCEENLGADEFAWNLRQDRGGYFEEDGHHYRRPIVCNRYRAPIELFDRHLYEKGSLVLHMLRRETGDAMFFKALNLYCTRHRGRNVITQDLQHAFEDATGRNLDFFFDQWVYKEGHPELEVSSTFDDKRKLISVTVKQTHKTSDATGLFRMTATIALMDAAGAETRHRVEVREREHVFVFACDKAPKAVRFDPGHDLVKTLKHKRGREALELELKHAPEAIGRAAAAHDLGKEGSPQAAAALRIAMLGDSFWGVQADAAAALGEIRTETALDALLEGVQLAHPKARRSVIRALGEFRANPRAADALAGVLGHGDPSYFVEAEAALALGKTRDPRAFAQLEKALERPSYLEAIRAHAIAAIAETRDDRALAIGREWCAYGRPPRARVAAIGLLARIAHHKESARDEIIDLLAPLTDDREFMVRMRLPAAFEEIGDQRGIAPMRRLAERDLDGRIGRRANEAVAILSEGRSHIEEGNRLRDDLDKLREQNTKLQQRLEKLEAGAAPPRES